MTIRCFASILVMGMGACLLLACSSDEGAETAAHAAPALTVQTVEPVRGQVAQHVLATGNIAAWQEVIVGAQSHGLRLAEVRAQVGDQVKKGQVLAVFAADSVQAEVLQARAGLLEAQAHAADAQGNAGRAASIADTGAVSHQQMSQLQAAAKAAQARVQAAQAVLRHQQLRQSYTRVTAPDDGVISARSATVGAVVPAGTELFRMVRRNRLEWRAEVAAADLGRVQPGVAVRVDLPTGGQVQGRVRALSPTLDAQRRLAVVYVDMPDAWAQGARAGMFASGRLEVGQADGWLVPQSAVTSRDGLDYVFVAGADGKVQQRRVQTGQRLDGQVHVVQGVEAGMALVAEGAGFLNDGDVVRVLPAPGLAAPAGATASAASAPASAASAVSAASAPPAP